MVYVCLLFVCISGILNINNINCEDLCVTEECPVETTHYRSDTKKSDKIIWPVEVNHFLHHPLKTDMLME